MKPSEKLSAKRPCKLQINQNGAWRDVLRFDGAAEGDAIQIHAPALAAVVGAKLRIVMDDGMNVALMHWTPADGWRDA